MPIICAICGEIFENIIDWRHLQQHKMSVKKYQELHGPNTADGFVWADYIRSRNQHRRGVKLSTEHCNKLKQSFRSREEKYRSGELIRATRTVSAEIRQSHSERMTEFARQNPHAVSERVRKAQATRKSRGPGNRLGSAHSDETKQKIKNSLLVQGERERQKTLEKYRELAQNQNITLLGREKTTVFFQCQICTAQFTRSLQLLQPSKLQSELCPICFPKFPGPVSKAENEIVVFLQELGIEQIVTRCRDVIPPQELDIYLPQYNLAIEYCGIYWHSELSGHKGPGYHQEKWMRCRDQNIQLVTIFEDEWRSKSAVVKSMIRYKIHQLHRCRVFARQCRICTIDSKTSSEFLKQNHIHGSAAAQVHLGLYHQDQLVYVMTFTKNNISRRNTQTWEIQRMAGSCDTLVVGGATKLFSHFIKTHCPTQVISYADLRWFTGSGYQHLGFSFSSNSKPGYWYVDKNYTTRKHRYALRKNKNDNPELTEWQNRQAQGWDRIWDCGHAKWIWKKENGQE
jgi:hypothetical protein